LVAAMLLEVDILLLRPSFAMKSWPRTPFAVHTHHTRDGV
jgi:hypothetical protein